LIGLASGEALEAGYESGRPSDGEARVIGGGLGRREPTGMDRRHADGDLHPRAITRTGRASPTARRHHAMRALAA
jgi:hypothetical protein